MGNPSDTALFVSRISKEHDLFMGTLYTIFCVLSLLGNGILLLVAYRKRSSLKPAEFFVVNLSISDLGMTVSLFPLAIPSAFAHKWLFGEIGCLYYAMCGVLFGLCSLINLTALSCVCCIKVCFPNYGNKFSSPHACLLVAGTWCYASVFAVGPLVEWGRYGPEPYGTACCIDWSAPARDPSAVSYVVCLFFFCYIVPCTIIFLSYAFILLTVRRSRQALKQHVSLQTKTTNVHALVVKLSVAVCIGFLSAWSPYAVVAMLATFGNSGLVPPIAFALAAIFAKSSTIYNPVVYLLFKPNFRKSLCRDTAQFRRKLCSDACRGSAGPEQKDLYQPTSHRGTAGPEHDLYQPTSHRGNAGPEHDLYQPTSHRGNAGPEHDLYQPTSHRGSAGPEHDLYQPTSHRGNAGPEHDLYQPTSHRGSAGPEHDLYQPTSHRGSAGHDLYQPTSHRGSAGPEQKDLYQPTSHRGNAGPEHDLYQPTSHRGNAGPEHDLHQPTSHRGSAGPEHDLYQPTSHRGSAGPEHDLYQPTSHRGSTGPEHDLYQPTSQRSKDATNSTRLSNDVPKSHGACLHCAEVGAPCHTVTPQRTARVLAGSTHSEVTVNQLSDKMQADFL